MSEYQYYRFECLDRILDSGQRQKLRRISSRAEITSSSFHVHYHYSDLKADPSDVVLNHFDIGFYYANWGSIDAYVKLPIGSIPCDVVQCVGHGFHVYENDQWQLLVFSLEEYHEYFDDEDADDFFLHLSALRAELLQGDWRLLYFIWLKELDSDDDVTPIPMIEFDFSHLSEAQLAFVALFEVPLGLLKALTLVLKGNPSHCPRRNCLNSNDWLSQLSEKEKDHLLTALFEQGELSRSQAMAMTRKGSELEHVEYAHWLDGQVIAPYIDIAEAQLEKEQAIAMAKRLAEEKVAKEAKLSEVYSQRDQVWLRIQEQANRACASGYDHASNDLHQLAEAYQFMNESAAFDCRFKAFILEHKNRKALIKRLQGLLVAS